MLLGFNKRVLMSIYFDFVFLDRMVGAVQTGVQFGWYFMRVINHFYVTQSSQLSL